MNNYSTPTPPRFTVFRTQSGRLRFALALALGPLAMHAQTTTWNNPGGSASFNTASNWSSGLPDASTQAVFSGASAGTVQVSSDISISSLLFSTTASGYSLTGSGKLTLLSTGTGTSSAMVYQPTTITSVQVSAPMVLGAATGSTQTIATTATSGNFYLYGAISSTNTVNLNVTTALGSTVNLMGSNTYSGNTSLTGFMKINTVANSGIASSLGTGSVVSLGSAAGIGTLVYLGTSTGSSNRTIDLPGTTSGGALDSSGTGALVWTGNVMASGAGNKFFTLQGSNTGANQFSGVIADNSSTNKTTLRKLSAGTWAVTGLNTHTGGTTIQAGTMSITTIANGGVASSLGASSNAAGNLSLSGGATLRYTGAAASSDRLFTLSGSASLDASGTGALSLTNTGNLSMPGSLTRTLTLTGTHTGANTLSAGITDQSASFPTSVTKTGVGGWTLAGASTYTGATTVSAGQLTLLGSLGNTAITVENGATLGGSGTATGSLLLSNGGTVAPGNGLGMLTVGAFTWTGGGELDFDLGTGNSSDRLAVTGAFAKSGSGFNFDFLSGGTAGGTYTLLTFGSNTGGFTAADFSYSNLATGLTGSFAVNAGSVTFSVSTSAIPEPSTYAAIFGGVALAGALWRRRRQKAVAVVAQ